MTGFATAPPNTPECKSIFGPSHFHLERGHAAQTVAERRHAPRDHAGVGNDCHIAFERLAISLQKPGQVAAANLFFALNDEVQVDGQIAAFFERLLDAENMREDLALVVRRTPRVDITVFQNRSEGRRIPQLERVGRLHIVMPVKHDGLAAGLMFVSCPDHRMSRGGNQLRLKADPV